MNILHVRRISQAFFLALFLWFCIASTFGTEWWQLRGWPVNLILQLDPLVAVGTLLTTHTLYRGLLWAAVTVAVTIVFGRVFCGWVCPFGTMHQFLGWLVTRKKNAKGKMEANRFRRWQVLKYFILLALLAGAAFPVTGMATLQTGLLDPIPLAHRSVNLALLPVAERMGLHLSAAPRNYEGAWIIGAVFLAALMANFAIPRFFCRFLCPTGALLGLLSRFAIFRIVKTDSACTHCDLCESNCEGAADPGDRLRLSECVMCMNCTDNFCLRNFIKYRAQESAEPDIPAPDMGRRAVLWSLASGVLAVPMLRIGGAVGANWNPATVRPPGSLAEEDFLERCIKCGQCMRVCPTNIIMPAGLDHGFESAWTPVLNFRIGTSGCQLNCTACGHVCPTAAIRPLTLDEKHGTGKHEAAGPLRIGTAFVDRGRCLPWAMDTPCIVCQENCPVTPKAIFIRDIYNAVRGAAFQVASVDAGRIRVTGGAMPAGRFATGDYFVAAVQSPGRRWRVTANTADTLTLSDDAAVKAGDEIEIQVHLMAPCVDISKCIGCGVCEHECPVSGLRAIRVTAENESRNKRSSLTLRRASA